jgi:dissimilatory sulfite reductase (desulfoviridin) alpha/beta subunit
MYGDATVPKMEVMAERCINCKSKKHVQYDELIGEDGDVVDSNRFDEVAKLEAMTPDERFKFWQNELSRCIRCNACRNVCPACTCELCI